jgi:hypothetical protein
MKGGGVDAIGKIGGGTQGEFGLDGAETLQVPGDKQSWKVTASTVPCRARREGREFLLLIIADNDVPGRESVTHCV